MPAGNVGRRYAQAVFDIAQSKGSLDKWAEDLTTITQVLGQANAMNFLENPKVSRADKQTYIQELLSNRVSPEAFNLAQILVQRGRQGQAVVVEGEYLKMLNRLRGVEVAFVTTAIPMNEAEEAQLKARLNQITGKQVTIKAEVNPDILGGVVARVGDTLIDGSIKTRLEALRKALV